MRKSDDPKAFARACERYCQMMADGKGSKAALAATGLSHAQAGLAWYESPLNPNHIVRGSVVRTGDTEADGVTATELRLGTHPQFPGRKLSWGFIMVAMDLTEGQSRALQGVATGIASEGTRIGRGGRYLNDEPRFYVGNRKGIGVEDAAPRRLDPEAVAATADEAVTVLPAKVKAVKAKASKRAIAAAKRAAKANS